MRKITLEQYHTELKAQGMPSGQWVMMKCPACGKVQCAEDLIRAGAGKDFDEVEKYLGFSCVGRWTNAGPPPRKKDMPRDKGCNWTLGGLLRIHELTVVTPDGEEHARFEVASKEEAEKHYAELVP